MHSQISTKSLHPGEYTTSYGNIHSETRTTTDGKTTPMLQVKDEVSKAPPSPQDSELLDTKHDPARHRTEPHMGFFLCPSLT